MATTGHCICGAVQVTMSEPASECVYCHCDSCKRQSGASGTYETIVSKSTIKIDGDVKQYLDTKTDSGIPLERWFCGVCGCPIYSATAKLPDKLVVKLGLFDRIPKATAEWYCKNKEDWEPTVDGASTYQKTPRSS